MKISVRGVALVVVVSFVIDLHLISAFLPPIPLKSPNQGRLAASGESSNDFTGSPIYQSMMELGYEERQRKAVSSELERADLSSLPWTVWRAMFLDFLERPEVISQQLQSDFGFTPLLAHQTRAAIVHALRREGSAEVNGLSRKKSNPVIHTSLDEASPVNSPLIPVVSEASQTLETGDVTTKRPLYKETIVNEHAKRRKEKKDQADYGLSGNYQESFPRLYSEMNEFLQFMTVPSTCSQETPIREATAVVYLRHAKLFLGWYIQTQQLGSEQAKDLSIETIIPNKEKDSASIILDFLLFLRSERHVSSSYEAKYVALCTIVRFARIRFLILSLPPLFNIYA